MGVIQSSINNMVGSISAAASVGKIVKGQAEANRIGQAQLEDSMMKDVEGGNINSLIANGFLTGEQDVKDLTKYLSEKTLTENALRESVNSRIEMENATHEMDAYHTKYMEEHPGATEEEIRADEGYTAAEEKSIQKGVAAQTAAEKANGWLMYHGKQAAAMRNRVRAHIKNIVGGRR